SSLFGNLERGSRLLPADRCRGRNSGPDSLSSFLLAGFLQSPSTETNPRSGSTNQTFGRSLTRFAGWIYGRRSFCSGSVSIFSLFRGFLYCSFAVDRQGRGKNHCSGDGSASTAATRRHARLQPPRGWQGFVTGTGARTGHIVSACSAATLAL